MRAARYNPVALGLVLLVGPAFGAKQRPTPETEPSAAFVVVVHPANQTESITPADLARLFLKTSRRWPDGTAVRVVDQSLASEVRAGFSRQVLQLSVLAVQAHWQRALFSGAEAPPPVLQSDAAVLAYVARNEGAAGYVSAAAAIPENVKQLEVTK